jgi:hypothetical protein
MIFCRFHIRNSKCHCRAPFKNCIHSVMPWHYYDTRSINLLCASFNFIIPRPQNKIKPYSLHKLMTTRHQYALLDMTTTKPYANPLSTISLQKRTGPPLSKDIYRLLLQRSCGPGSSVGIATELRAGRSGDRIPVDARFSAPVQTGPGAHSASCTMGTGSFPGVESGRSVTLNPHPLLVPWSKNRVQLYLYSP